ncbi:MAG: hypothetical protein HYR74_10255 [Candidatus Eisenbacteria bacterium]|nr:hypothetical protein [Candidatus Eisenbacteria bacterium]
MNADLLRRIEAMAIRGAERHWALMPAAVAKRVRPEVVRVADGLFTMMPKSDALRMNRVIGLGHRGEAGERAIDEIIERARAARLHRFSVVLGPGPQRARIARWLESRRLRKQHGYALLVRDLGEPVPRVATDFTVRRIGPAMAKHSVAVLAEAFATPASRRDWALAAAASRDYAHFMAFDGTTPVAVGALAIDDGLGWLGGAATRTRWRKRGAQSAIIVARLRHAQRAGCAWAWSQTGEHVRGRPDGSRRNLARLGFEQACVEPIYVWEGQ